LSIIYDSFLARTEARNTQKEKTLRNVKIKLPTAAQKTKKNQPNFGNKHPSFYVLFFGVME